MTLMMDQPNASTRSSTETDLSQTIEKSDANHVNIGSTERILSAAAGGVVAILGLRAASLPGLLAAVAGGALVHRGVTGHCHGYQLLGVDTSNDEAASPTDYYEKGIHVSVTLTIDRSPEELYQFWRRFENLSTFMKHVESVKEIDEKRSHWVVKAPAGRTVEWDAEIINDEPNALIAWRSLAGAQVDNAGSVRFVKSPVDRGTEVRVVLDYIPPAGTIGKWVAQLFGEEPTQQIRADLHRFKQLMETGEVATVEGQAKGNCAG